VASRIERVPSLDAPAPATVLLSRVPSPALVIGGIASVQIGSAIAAKLFSQTGSGGAALLRLAFGGLLLSIVWRPRARSRTRRELLLAAAFGLVLATMNVSFYHAIQRIPLGIAVAIEFFGPLTVALIGSRRPRDVVWVALALLGILALTHGSTHGIDALGVMFALIAACMWSGYILLNARLGRTFQDGGGLALAVCIAAIAALPDGVAEGGASLLRPHSLIIGAVVGLLSSAIPYSFENEALRRIATNVFGVLMSLEPAMAALAGFVVLGQNLSARESVGIALVMLASAGASRHAREAPLPP
jgi:inner membrane transporter RhtA